MLIKQPYALHHLVKRGLARCRLSVFVVKLLRSVDGNAHKEVVLLKEFAPFIVKQCAVGLYAIVHLPTTSVGTLQLQCTLIKRDGAHQRFAAMPCKEHFGRGLRLDILAYELLQHLVGDDVAGAMGI